MTVACAVFWIACGESRSEGSGGADPDGGAAGDAARAGAGASTSGGGAGGAGAGGGGMAGSGACSPVTGMGVTDWSFCPTITPIAGVPCAPSGLECAYEDCAGAGRTIGRCVSGAWSVENGPCDDFVYCADGTTCGPGAVCVYVYSIGTCLPNPCGDGAIGCNCMDCAGRDCRLDPSLRGITIDCRPPCP